MFSSAEKTKNVNVQRQQQAAGQTFFRKAGEESFFGAYESPSFFSSSIQAKLSVSSPDDPQEKEADAVADHVVQQLTTGEPLREKETTVQTKALSSISPLLQKKCTDCEKEDKVQKKGSDTFEAMIPEEKLRRKADPSADEKEIDRKCAACDDEKLYKKSQTGASQISSPDIINSLDASKGGGSPLSGAVGKQMESSLGADFSSVRLHTDTSAVQMSRDLNAQAFTHGADIYFNEGKYDDYSASGRHLLAHELTHVVQQTPNAVKRKPAKNDAPPASNFSNQLFTPTPLFPPMSFAEPAYPPLQEVYFARKDNYFIAFPKTVTSPKQLAEYLFVTEDIGVNIPEDGPSQLDMIVEGLTGMNSIIGNTIYGKTPIVIGDLMQRFKFRQNVISTITNGPLFSPNVSDPQNELEGMGVFSIAEFIETKSKLDIEVKKDVSVIIEQLNKLKENSFWDSAYEIMNKNLQCEQNIMVFIRKWASILISKQARYISSRRSEYLDILMSGLGQKIGVIDNILVDEQTSYDDLLLNRFVFHKDELNHYLKMASINYTDYTPHAELSLWDDFAKPGLMRIPSIITEMSACFFDGIPVVGKDIAEGLHGIAENYNVTVLPNDKQANEQSMAIACVSGGLIFDLAGGELIEVMNFLQKIQEFKDIYDAFDSTADLIKDLPSLLSAFSDEETFFDMLFGISETANLDRLEAFASVEDKAPAVTQTPTASGQGQKNAIDQLKSALASLRRLVRKILKPVFAVRRMFLNLIEKAQEMFMSNDAIVDFLTALKEGKKIEDLGADIMMVITDQLAGFILSIKDSAIALVDGIEQKINDQINSFKIQIENAVSNFALTKLEGVSKKIKSVMSLSETVRNKVLGLITEHVVGPFLEYIGLGAVTDKIDSIVKIVGDKAKAALEFLFNTIDNSVKEELEGFHLDLKKADSGISVNTLNEKYFKAQLQNSPGSQLPEAVRGEMEELLGSDFSSVKVHDNSAAHNAAETVKANAFTMNDDIYFNHDKYSSQSISGQQLLAHELTHVAQRKIESSEEIIQRSSFQKASGKVVKKSLSGKNKKGKKKNTPALPPEPLQAPTGIPGTDIKLVEKQLLELTNFVNPAGGTRMKINPKLADSSGRTNAERMKKGLCPLLDGSTKVELHHVDQNFFEKLDEISSSYHRSVDDDLNYHPYAEDAGYLSWRGIMAWYNGRQQTLGQIYHSLRGKYWRKRAKDFK